MVKRFLILILLISQSQALDFHSLKKRIVEYVGSLDHPNRDTSNTFSKNLAIAGEAHHTTITIYSAGLAIISEEKNVTLDHGGNVKLMYKDVPSKVDLSSVSMIFDHNVTLYSQKYAYDVVNYESLLRRYVGKYILYIGEKGDKKQKKATLLATKPIIVKDAKNGTIFTPYKVFFENIPEDMAVTPSLFWDLRTDATSLVIKLEYLTHAISWKSDYNLYLKSDKLFNLNSWITASNHSGASYKDAKITVVTGKVKQVKHASDQNKTKQAEIQPQPEKIDHLQDSNRSRYSAYVIPHRENLQNKEEKQIVFIRKKGISYAQYLLNEKVYRFDEENLTKLSFSKVLAFKNSQTNHLGISLPQGVVRVYNYRTGGLTGHRFIGSTTMQDIKKDELVELRIGEAEGVVADEQLMTHTSTPKEQTIRYRIRIKNSKERAREIKLKRSIPAQVEKVTIQDNCKAPCQRKKLSDLSLIYTVDLNVGETYELDITYRLKAEKNSPKESL